MAGHDATMRSLPRTDMQATCADTGAPVPCQKCGACCIAPSITTPMPNMPNGKPAGMRCVNLNAGNLCTLYGRPDRPVFCSGWKPSPEVCGEGFTQAMKSIAALELETA